MLTMPLRQLTGGRYQVERLCVKCLCMLVFQGSEMGYHFDF